VTRLSDDQCAAANAARRYRRRRGAGTSQRKGALFGLYSGATLGALLTTWVTFLPCFVWIFAGAPYIEKLRQHRALSAALAAITATVVGVIANLALWFAINTLFTQTRQVTGFGLALNLPELRSMDPAMLALVGTAGVLLFVFRLPLLVVLGLSAGLGIAWWLPG